MSITKFFHNVVYGLATVALVAVLCLTWVILLLGWIGGIIFFVIGMFKWAVIMIIMWIGFVSVSISLNSNK